MTRPSPLSDRAESSETTYKTTYDPITDSVTEELLNTLTTMQEFRPDEVDPLAYTIDPDALDALVSHRENATPREGACVVEFEYGPHHVRVTNDGTITVRTPE